MMPHVESPKIVFTRMIDSHRLELYWDQDVTGANVANHFNITLRGAVLPIVDEGEDNWHTKPTYEPEKKRTTFFLQKPLKLTDLGHVAVRLSGTIKNEFGQQALQQITYTVDHWQSFYTRFTSSRSRILIQSSNHANRQAHRVAAGIIDTMLEKQPDVAAKMAERGVRLSIYGLDEYPYDIPEHRGGADVMKRPVEGYGGEAANPITSISEKNILRIREGVHQTRYLDECILVHEFGHAVHLLGINFLEDQTLAERLKTIYRSAKAKQLWPNTYAGSSIEEYFATLSTIWFNVMAESRTGEWDGVRGPINTREELKEYDPDAYAYFKDIYPKTSLLPPWDRTPDHYPYAGRMNELSI